jgi:PIN domain nuclease of toxin-antitoxin system
MILLDTHVLVWSASQPQKLGAKTRRLMETKANRAELSVCVCTWLELELISQRRGALSASVLLRANELVSEFAIQQIAINERVIGVAGLFVRHHGDPFDLMIAAAAIVSEATLVTADQVLLDWPDRRLKRLDARI